MTYHSRRGIHRIRGPAKVASRLPLPLPRHQRRADLQVRAGDQLENGEGARADCATYAARPRRRGDRVKRCRFIMLLNWLEMTAVNSRAVFPDARRLI